MRARRTRYVFFLSDDQRSFDIGLLLRGTAKPVQHTQLYAISILAGREVPVTREELDFILSLPSSDWIDVDEEDEHRARDLAHDGVLLSDGGDPELARLRALDEQLEADWNIYGALYHFLTRWRGLDLRDFAERGGRVAELEPPTVESVREFFAYRGPPPAAFHSVADGSTVELPVVEPEGALYDVLRRRRTTRAFDRDTPLPLEVLAVLLRFVFGCHGYARVLGEVVTLKKSSPSGGGLHPIEVYPLVSRVDGLDAGIYHYNVRDHVLEPVERLAEREATELATHVVCGQTYLSSAHVLFLLTARFQRAFWKYERHPKGYALMLLDAAHLSQTLYLVATELGLGAFVTAAINNADIDDRLGLDGCAEGALLICGCGMPADELSPVDPDFLPFVPRETPL